MLICSGISKFWHPSFAILHRLSWSPLQQCKHYCVALWLATVSFPKCSSLVLFKNSWKHCIIDSEPFQQQYCSYHDLDMDVRPKTVVVERVGAFICGVWDPSSHCEPPRVNLIQHAKCLGHTAYRSTVIARTHRHSRPTAAPGPLHERERVAYTQAYAQTLASVSTLAAKKAHGDSKQLRVDSREIWRIKFRLRSGEELEVTRLMFYECFVDVVMLHPRLVGFA